MIVKCNKERHYYIQDTTKKKENTWREDLFRASTNIEKGEEVMYNY